MKVIYRQRILKLLILIFIITVIIIGMRKLAPKSKADEKNVQTISVTYKAGDGIGEDITLTQEVFGEQTQGENDYTDGKIVLSKNGRNGVNFTHDSKVVTINDVQYNYDMLVSGWKLTSVNQNGQEITTFIEPENYNYADKTNANKDIGTIYAEKGWYIVPEGVTSITVEAVWGWAIYVKNPYNTMVYDTNYWFDTASSIASGRTGASEANFGTNNTDDVVASIKRAYELIYLAGETGANYDVYSHLIVLCGDIDDVRPSTSTVPDTTYADIVDGETIFDINQVNSKLAPTDVTNAYNSYWGSSYRQYIDVTFTSDPSQDTTYKLYQKCQTWGWTVRAGIRFDNVIYSLVKKVQGSLVTLQSYILYPGYVGYNYKIITTENFYTWSPNETNTELNNWRLTIYYWDRGTEIKVLGGKIELRCNDHPKSVDLDLQNMKYITIGGNVYLNEFCSGTYSELKPTALKTIYNVPTVCVIGGYINNVYLTGTSTVNFIGFTREDNTIYFYMSDGYCAGTIYGSGGTPVTDGNVSINIENVIVNKIYGGGSKETGDIDGNVYINLKNVQIGQSEANKGSLYGGPEYGDIVGDVHLNLDNIKVYGDVYSAGYGSSSVNYRLVDDNPYILDKEKSEILALLQAGQEIEPDYENGIYYKIATRDGQLVYYAMNERIEEWLTDSTKYLGFYNGDENQIVLVNIPVTQDYVTSVNVLDRLTIKSLSAATVGNVYTNIANSNITGNVYGGGNKGSVLGNTELTITNTTVGGDIYGGGYSSEDTQVDVYTKQCTQYNLGYAYINGEGTISVNTGNHLYQIDENGQTINAYELFTWSNLDYLKTNSADWTEEQLNSYLEIATAKGLSQETPKVVNGLDYTNKLVYSANADKMGTVYGNVVLKVSDSTVSGKVYGGGNGGQVQGNVTQEIDNVINDKIDIYGGGYVGNVGGSTQTTVLSGTINNVFGGGYSGVVSKNAEVIIKKGNFTNVFGGGDQSYVGGNTIVTIGNGTDVGITVSGLVYGGGRGQDADGDGDASDYTTVKGSSQVTISGIKTNVENYGSIKLGKVDGNVDVVFKNYWTGNATAKYKTMNGIDRATAVSFENSYVLLENKDENGDLAGIKAIGDLNIPDGSGLKISANGEITGDFNGGGELYLDSEVCLTVGGNLAETPTILILNPELFSDENVQKIIGGVENPYLKVKGTTLATEEEADAIEFVSSERRYEILSQKYKEEDSTQYSYYYISETIIIRDYVEIDSSTVNDKVYTGEIKNTNNVIIENDGVFTTSMKLHYDLLSDESNTDKFTALTRDFVLKIDEEQLATLPIGTEILMIFEDVYYSYVVVQKDITKVPLTQFKDTTQTAYTNFTDLRDEENATTSTNEITGSITYRYDEEYRFIVNFANVNSPLANATYYPMININDGVDTNGNAVWIEDDQIESANVIEIQNREYTATYKTDREDYEGNGIIQITGEISISEISDTITQNAKDLSARVSLKDNEGNMLEIPSGAVIQINDQTYDASNGTIEAILIENITNTKIVKNMNITVDFSQVLPQNRLETGNYSLCLELVKSKNNILQNLVKGSSEVVITINNISKDSYGIKAELLNPNGIAEDRLQLIQKENNEQRTINLQYKGSLENAKVKIKVLERTAPFTYTESENSKKIQTQINSTNVSEITSLVDGTATEILADFTNIKKLGTYRIVFELYDKYDAKKTESFVNFIVIEKSVKE